jgi:hypothetical protein
MSVGSIYNEKFNSLLEQNSFTGKSMDFSTHQMFANTGTEPQFSYRRDRGSATFLGK